MSLYWNLSSYSTKLALVKNQVSIRDCSLLKLKKSSRRVAVLDTNTLVVYALFFEVTLLCSLAASV
jgi:hypothetical protein